MHTFCINDHLVNYIINANMLVHKNQLHHWLVCSTCLVYIVFAYGWRWNWVLAVVCCISLSIYHEAIIGTEPHSELADDKM